MAHGRQQQGILGLSCTPQLRCLDTGPLRGINMNHHTRNVPTTRWNLPYQYVHSNGGFPAHQTYPSQMVGPDNGRTYTASEEAMIKT